MKKRFKLIMFLFVAVVVLSGCGNISFSFLELKDGSLLESITITVNPAMVQDKNQNLVIVKQTIEDIVTAEVNGYFTLFNQFVTLTGSSTTQQQKEALKNAVTKTASWEGNSYTSSIKFSAAVTSDNSFAVSPISIFRFFYTGSTLSTSTPEIEIEETFFVTRYIQKTDTVFSDQQIRISRYIDSFNSAFLLDDVSFTYNYGTPSNRLHSNASQITKKNGVFVHSWNIAASEINTKEVEFYNIEAIKVNWYFLALIITSVLVSSMLIYYIARNKVKRKFI